MRWDRDHESSNIEDRRAENGGGYGLGGGMGAGGFPLWGLFALAGRFGWRGIVIAIAVVLGLTYRGNLCSGSRPQQAVVPAQRDTAPGENDLEHFVGFVLDDVQQTWRANLPGYEDAHLVLFRRAIGSACGTATSAVGPFYCQLDHKVYIDLAFYEELRRKFGAPGDFAQAYVIAHELGHHVQNLKGLLGRGEAASVQVELQADCLAGAWAKSANSRGLVEAGDIDEALNAATQIGDDTIQRKAGREVQPETFTHGSAAQRSAAFKRGFEGGAPACGVGDR
ncbi:MAG TPA: neutral zinc metallopeptidase [Kofleriaceae bacterium]|nr:neutral zinc metallopeptidase [Kofleriaceae bacterium]